MLKFSHDVAGGQGNLIVTALQSPNFVHDVSGWQIAKDGSAEFNDLVIRGTFYGTDYVINSDGAFFYSPSEGAGNLIASISAGSGTDQYGNAWLPGNVSYGPGNGGIGYAASQLGSGVQSFYTAPAYGGPWTLQASIFADDTGLLLLQALNSIWLASPMSQPLQILEPGSSTTPETWHAITLDSGWSAVSGFDAPRYQLLPDGNLQLSGAATLASSRTTAANLNSSHPLPSAYRPVNTHRYRSYDSSPTARCAVQIAPTGVIEGLANSGGYQIIEIDGIIPLN